MSARALSRNLGGSFVKAMMMMLPATTPTLAQQAQGPPPPVRLQWGGSASMMETGSLRIDEGEEVQISLTGYTAVENYADLKFHKPTYAVGDQAIVRLLPSAYPHMFNLKAVGSGTTWLSGESAGLRIVLPIVAGRAKDLTVAADIPANFRVGRVKINVAPSQLSKGSLRLAVGEEAELGIEALYEESMQRATLQLYPVTWVSSDPSVVAVGSSKATPISRHIVNVAARRNGSATLTASVQGVKAILPVLVGTARSGGRAAAVSHGNVFSTGKEPFTVAKPVGPVLGEGGEGLVLRAPEVFGARTYRLERSQPAAGDAQFTPVAAHFRLEKSSVVMADTTAPGTRDGGPALYRVVAIDHSGREVAGEPTAILTDGSGISGATITRGASGAEISWTSAAGTQYKIARFASDGSSWTIIDVPAAGTYTDASGTPGSSYVVLGLDGSAYAQFGPTLRLR